MRHPRLPALFACALACACARPAQAGDAPAPAPAKAEQTALGQLADEERWTFDPHLGRIDTFYDLEAELVLRKLDEAGTAAEARGGQVVRPAAGDDQAEQAMEWSRRELTRVEAFVFARKWDDAIKVSDEILKILARYSENPAVATIITKVKGYRSQAEEAKIYEEAQARFDALGLKVEGILWSSTGSLAVIGGEPRARAVNERVKDCVIINIDTNRVDFLFHYNRRRFEFQRYVGEDVAAKPASR
ncbi:MAG: hypothetical protein H0X38_08695 [Planctomycetes bacterium]|nr:hypothetical protein [Planctomycetota bacterium]